MHLSLARVLTSLGFGSQQPNRRRRPARATSKRRGTFESLELRRMMTRTAVLDFDGEDLTGPEMVQGGWPQAAVNESSFHSLFTSAHPDLDMNSDGQVNWADAQLAVNRIVAQVRQDFAPYDLRVVVGDQDTYQGLLTDGQAGDAISIITGGFNVLSTDAAMGLTPWADLGNEHDEISWVFGGDINQIFNGGEVINATAETISHELGHAFGLGHIKTTPIGMAEA